MSGYIEDPRQCEAIHAELAELALGTLSGRIRSECLDHVASCGRCAAELEQLSIVADSLLQLAPEMEPPLGFELRLAERLKAAATVRRHSRFRRTSVLVAAAAAVVLFGFGLGSVVAAGGGGNQNQSATAGLTAANLTSHGSVLGRIIISADSPPWMFVTISGGSLSGNVKCEVTLVGGKVETIGVFKISGGYGAWDAPLRSPGRAVRSAQLIAANGTVLASARLA